MSVDGTLNSMKYMEILQARAQVPESYLYNIREIPSDASMHDNNGGQFPSNVTFMLDNAPAHRSQIIDELKRDHGIHSPDLNPIEHVWAELGRRLAKRGSARNLQQLSAWLLEECAVIPQELINNLIRSMPRRVRAVIEASGDNTRY